MIKSAHTVLLASLLLSSSGGTKDIGSPTQAMEGQQLPSSCIVVHVPQVGVGNGGQDVGQPWLARELLPNPAEDIAALWVGCANQFDDGSCP